MHGLKNKGSKGGELLGQPSCRGGLEHLQQNCGEGSGEGKGSEANIAVTGKRELEAMTKLCLGLGNWSCLSWVKKPQAQSPEHSSGGRTLPVMCRPFTWGSKLYVAAVKKKTQNPKKPTQKLQNFEHFDEEKAVSTLHFQEIPPGKPYELLVLQV